MFIYVYRKDDTRSISWIAKKDTQKNTSFDTRCLLGRPSPRRPEISDFSAPMGPRARCRTSRRSGPTSPAFDKTWGLTIRGAKTGNKKKLRKTKKEKKKRWFPRMMGLPLGFPVQPPKPGQNKLRSGCQCMMPEGTSHCKRIAFKKQEDDPLAALGSQKKGSSIRKSALRLIFQSLEALVCELQFKAASIVRDPRPTGPKHLHNSGDRSLANPASSCLAANPPAVNLFWRSAVNWSYVESQGSLPTPQLRQIAQVATTGQQKTQNSPS